MFNLPKDIETEIKMFCELNQIEDVEGLILNCIKGGFSIEKFGRTPVKAGIEIIEKEKEVIKDTEVKNLLGEIEELKNKLQLKPKEINKEVIVEDTKKVEGLQIEIKKLRNKIDEYEDILRHFQRFSGNKTTHLKSSNLNDELYTD